MDDSTYRLRDTDHTDLFGAYLAIHAIPDALLLLHTTVGCKFKTQRHLVEHDRARESHNRRVWTGVDDVQMIRGSAESLDAFARTWHERRRPGLLAIATNATVELTGLDIDAVVAGLRRDLPCPVIAVRAPGYDGTMWRGYRRVVDAVAGLADWSRPAAASSVALVGYLFDRYERDHAANLAEVRRLLAAVGLDTAGVLLGGEPVASVLEAASAATLVTLPYAHPLADGLASRTGRTVARADLPIGLKGTAEFLRTVAAAAGVDATRVEGVIERELARAAPLVARVAQHTERLRVAVYLDTPMAAAVTAYLAELGVEVPLVCLADGEEASVEAFHEATRRLDAPLPDQPRVVPAPSRDRGIELYREAASVEPVPVVVGSSVQRDGLAGLDVAVIELGFPSAGKHWVYPVPFMGFNGAVAIAQRLMDARERAF
jgi:nitrogenase molybdenum-iron protein beta chain